MYTPYAGAVGMLLHVKVKFSMGKLKISVVVHFRSYRTSLSISTSRSRYEADLVVCFVQAQWDRQVQHNHQPWNYLVKRRQLYSGIWN